ncbi:MAG: hypothetical protein DRO40_00040 [Thermoprotei archaeon]|nr:MAG: hypothetical protein DRO40_00040 [Thermoprotei archaeon]
MDSKEKLAAMVDDYIDSYKRVINLLNKIGKYKLGPIIDKLRSTRIAGDYSLLSKELGINEEFLKQFIKRIRKLGLEFTIDVNTLSLGLMEFMVYLPTIIDHNDIPFNVWLKFYVITHNPVGTFISYYIPANKRILIEMIKEAYRELIKKTKFIQGKKRVYMIYNIMRSQPTFSTDPVRSFFKYNWDIMVKELNEIAYKTGLSERNLYWSNLKYTDPPDIVDLIILKELEKDAFKTIHMMAKEYPFSLKVFNKHLYLHVYKRNLIKGIFLKTGFTSRPIDSFHVVILKTSDKDKASILISFFKYKPWVYVIRWGHEILDFFNENDNFKPDKYVVVISMAIPSIFQVYLARLLYQLRQLNLIDEAEIFSYDTVAVKKWGIPYRFYSQSERTWTLDVEKNIDILEKRIFRRMRQELMTRGSIS